MLSLVVTTRPGSGRSSCRSPQKVEREKEEARNERERDGEEEEEKEQVEEEGEGERERNARQSLPRFFREIAVGRPTKGISILNPIGGYARPFHLFATGPKLVPLSRAPLLSSTIPRGGHRRTIRYDRHYLDAEQGKKEGRGGGTAANW